MKQDMNLNIRFPRELWKTYLKEMEIGTISKFCRDAIIEKVNKEFSVEFADGKIQYHTEEVKKWKQKKKDLTADPETIKEILKGGLRQFEYFQKEGDVLNFKKYLQNTIMHRLNAAGCTKYNLDELIKLYEEGVV